MIYTLTKLPNKTEEKPSGKFTLTKPSQTPSVATQLGRGFAQGGLDLASLPLFPFDLAQAGTEKLLGVQRPESGLSPGQEQQAQTDVSLLDKEARGEKLSLGELMMLGEDEDLIPRLSLDRPGSPIAAIQENIPQSGMLQESVRRGVRSGPFGMQAVLGDLIGLGARSGVEAVGGGETAQNVADILGGLSTAFYTPQKYKNIPYIAEGTGPLAKIEAQIKPAALEKRVLGLSDDIIREADQRMTNIAQETMSDFGQFSARETEDLISKGNRASILNKVSPIDKLPKQAWEEISVAANDIFDAEKKVYSQIYETVREASKKIEYAPISALNVARRQLKKITNIDTSPAGYSQVENIIRSTLKDLSGKNVNMEKFAQAWQSGDIQEVSSFIEKALATKKPVTADKLMDLSIRLGDAINYEELTPSIKDLLKPIRSAVKEDYRRAIGKRPSILQAYDKADDLYKKTANRFGKDIINKLRTSENAEMLGQDFLKPSNYENLVNVFGSGNSKLSEAERQLVELIGKQGQETARETVRQLEPYLSKAAKEAANDFISLGDNLSLPGQRRLLQSNILNDVAASLASGNRPQFTLNSMRTPQGYQVAKDTLGRTAQGKKLFKVLEKQVAQDLFDSITQNGTIDWNKAKKILNDPGYETVMNQIMGVDGVQFIKNIEKYSNNVTKNLVGKKFGEPSGFNKFYNAVDTPAKLLMASFFGSKVASILGVAIGAKALTQFGAKIITSPRTRQAILNLSDPNLSSKQLIRDGIIINEFVNKDEI